MRHAGFCFRRDGRLGRPDNFRSGVTGAFNGGMILISVATEGLDVGRFWISSRRVAWTPGGFCFPGRRRSRP
jgi:hypothetical protein